MEKYRENEITSEIRMTIYKIDLELDRAERDITYRMDNLDKIIKRINEIDDLNFKKGESGTGEVEQGDRWSFDNDIDRMRDRWVYMAAALQDNNSQDDDDDGVEFRPDYDIESEGK